VNLILHLYTLVPNPYHHDLNGYPDFFPPEALVDSSHRERKGPVCSHKRILTSGCTVVSYYQNRQLLSVQHIGPYSPIQFASHQVNTELKIKYLSYLLEMYFIEAEIYNVVFWAITLSSLAWEHQLAEKLTMEHCAYTYQAKQCSVIMSYFPHKKPQFIQHEIGIIMQQ